jgi:hypothetical protein
LVQVENVKPIIFLAMEVWKNRLSPCICHNHFSNNPSTVTMIIQKRPKKSYPSQQLSLTKFGHGIQD